MSYINQPQSNSNQQSQGQNSQSQAASQNRQGQISRIPRKRSRRFFLTSFLFAILIIGGTWWILSCVSSRLTWKAVFLDSNQVYFGRFIDIPFSSNITIHDVHYIKKDSDDANSTSTEEKPDISVLSVFGDLHSPEDTMKINKSHILYYQKIRPESVLFRGLSESVKK